jgi:eukaryotic-like serine/threonine-protein kinase
MTIAPGARLGPYEITRRLGAGGMGEVYEAVDPRLDRRVAVKVLPPESMSDPDARARFEREARAIAALNHPHICGVHDVGTIGDVDFLVLELLDGETLAARIARRPIPLNDALDLAKQIVDALAAAHRAGITHRDLKPANIMLTASGVKLLDFGLATRRSDVPPAGHAEVTEAKLTRTGVLVGTLQYMSPEQLEGRPADACSDIFACGAVLYEMLTGRPAFEQSSPAAFVASVLHGDPPSLLSIRPSIPRALDRLVRKCLARNPDDRWHCAHDLQIELAWIADGPVDARQSPGRPRTLRWASLLSLVLLCGAALGVGVWMRRAGQSGPRPPSRFNLAEPPGTNWDSVIHPSLSPDGRRIAVAAAAPGQPARLWVRSLDSVTWRAVSGAVPQVGDPFWSPDGRFVAFMERDKLIRADAAGGPRVAICDIPGGARATGGTWSAEDVILFGTWGGPIYRVPATGGTPEAVTRLDIGTGATGHGQPHFLPDGQHFLHMEWGGRPSLFAQRLDGTNRTLLKTGLSTTAMFVAPSSLVFVRDNRLVAQQFDSRRLQMQGAEIVVEQGRIESFFVTSAGTLAYRAAGEQEGRRYGEITPTNAHLAWLDRAGRVVGSVTPRAGYFSFRLSPDGRAAVVERFDDSNSGDLWVYDVRRHAGVRVTSDPARESDPAWSPEGERLVFSRIGDSGQGELVLARADGKEERTLLEGASGELGPYVADWSHDGRFVAYVVFRRPSGTDIRAVPIGGGEQVAVADTGANEMHARFSPDGRWLAYASDESGRFEIYVQAFPVAGRRVLVSTGGGKQPAWRADGRELFYLAPDRTLMSVRVQAGETFDVSDAEPLFRAPVAEQDVGREHYAPSADGQRFLVNVVTPVGPPPPVGQTRIVLDWGTVVDAALRGQ